MSVTFTSTNFSRWNRNVRRALIAKNKEGFINGLIPMPENTYKDYLRWTRVDYMVMSWILSSMSPTLADDFAYISNSANLWRESNERVGKSNGPLFYQMKKETNALKQANLTIVAYYGKIKKLWDEPGHLLHVAVVH